MTMTMTMAANNPINAVYKNLMGAQQNLIMKADFIRIASPQADSSLDI